MVRRMWLYMIFSEDHGLTSNAPARSSAKGRPANSSAQHTEPVSTRAEKGSRVRARMPDPFSRMWLQSLSSTGVRRLPAARLLSRSRPDRACLGNGKEASNAYPLLPRVP